MRTKRLQKLLAAFLSAAMLTSLLTVPVAAGEVTTTTAYNFQSDEFRACGVGTAAGAFTWTQTDNTQVTGTAAFIQNNNSYGILLNNGGTITLPVSGNCDIAVTFKQRAHLTLGTGSDVPKIDTENSGTEATETLHYTNWAEGTTSVTLNMTGSSYILKIEVSPLTAPDPTMKLDRTAVDFEVGGAAVTVTPTINYLTNPVVSAESDNTAVATVAPNNGAVTITPVGAGSATVTVSVTDDELTGKDPLTAECTIFVRDPNVNLTEWDFTIPAYQETAPANYRGLTISGGKAGGASNGVAFFNANNASIQVPVDGPSTITVKTSYNWDIQLGDDATTRATAGGDGSGTGTVEFTYTGTAETATIKALNGRTWIKDIAVKAIPPCTKTEGCTLANGHTGDCVVEGGGETPVEPTIPADAVQKGTINFKATGDAADPAGGNIDPPATTGVTFSSGCKIQVSQYGSHGLTTTDAETVTLKLGAEAVVTVLGCQHGKDKITGATAAGTAVDVPDAWSVNGDPEYCFEKVPAGDFVLTLAKDAYIHSINVDYSIQHDPQLTLSESTVSLKTDSAPATVTAMTRFAEGAITATPKTAGVVEVSVSGKTITITPKTKGYTDVEVGLEGTSLTKTIGVTVKAAGKTYVADGAWSFDSDNSDYAQLKKDALAGLIDGMVFTGFSDDSNSHGLKSSATSSIAMSLSDKATISVTVCGFSGGDKLQLAAVNADGEAVGTVTRAAAATAAKGDNNSWLFTAKEVPAGEITLNITNGGSYIHTIEVHYSTEIEAGSRNIQVWDFAGKTETGEEYDNNITAEDYLAAHAAAVEVGKELFKQTEASRLGCFAQGPTAFGSLSMYHEANDRPYIKTDNTELTGLIHGYANAGKYETAFDDGYAALGGWYCNGAGSASKRYITVAQVQAGDTLVVYAGSSSGDVTYTVQGPEAQKETFIGGTSNTAPFTVVAQETGSYKIWPAGGKPVYNRVKLIPGIGVSGKLDFANAPDFAETDYQVKFTNLKTGQVTLAKVDTAAKTYTVSLAPGYDYRASLVGATGYGITSATKTVSPALSELKSGKTHDLGIGPKVVYDYTGSITGFAQGYDTSKLAVTLTPDPTSESDPVELTINKTDLTFTAKLDPDVDYTASLSGANDYQVKSPAKINHGEATTENIVVEPKAVYAASGKFVVLDPDNQFAPLYPDSTYDALPATVTALSFKNVDDDYTYTATVADGGYTVNLRAGGYEAVATVDGYSTKGHVRVVDGAVSKDLLFVPTADPAAVDYAADVYVGDAAKTPNFKTVTGALAYIKRMTRTGDQRVTVHIAPGTYREQIAIESKNVTFVNDTPSKEVKLTWYYGIAYTYYSAKYVSNTESWYDPELAFDRFSKPNADVARWGATVRVRAPGFQAENITFENSFNYYLTDEELADGVVPNGSGISFIREYGADVASKAATERAAAIWVDTNSGKGDMTEFKDCKFLSSQDTFGTGKRMYLKDCYIEGMTDFICGPGDVVFDTCTLNWKGYSEKAQGGYLTAPQTDSSETGYLFRNCYVSGDTKLMLVGGAMGRTWGAASTGCIFYNTTLQSADMITEPTWVDMQNFDASKATKIHEWGTMLMDGTKVDLSKREEQNTVAKTEPTIDVKGTYFKDWVPTYYVEEVEGVALAAAPTVSDNGDINLPHPGHTLTVAYTLTPEANNANDVSTIQWYRVAADGTETLVKTSAANADKTYQIQEADVGAKIKVTVTPKTMGGQTGEAMSFTVATAVQEGYDDPSDVVDPELGAGVNVFLAGDSTVKDYSAKGMWNKGKLQAEGSWGEWLQNFFNDKVTVVNYAQGGRTTRSFIEQDGSLDKIDATMKKGDFLFAQFGHNDCYTADDRYVPLGITAAQKTYAEGGVYPDATADGKTTYTGYLKKYIEVTEKHEATTVLMTPVARMYYNSDGTIKPHHDASTDGTNDNEYCKAVKWVYDWAKAQGYNVVFIDSYKLTADLFEKAYADCAEADKQTYGKQLMGIDEKTHNSKLGGLIEAAIVAQAIQNSDLTIAKAVQAPTQLTGKTPKGETAFVVDSAGKLAAYDNLTDFANHATYWEGEGKTMFDAIAAKAAELDQGSTDPGNNDSGNNGRPGDMLPTTASGNKNNGTTATNPDGSKTTTKTDRKGNTTVTTVATDGSKVETVTAKNGDKTITVSDAKGETQVAIKLPADIPAPKDKFVDVPDGHWAEKAINDMAGLGMVNGVNEEAHLFDMTSPMTRGSIATILFRFSNGAPGKPSSFTDVSGGQWYTDAIGWAAETGVVTGYSETVFAPNDTITREQLAVMLARFAKLIGMDTTANASELTAYADGATTDIWALDGMAWCVSKGIITGKPGSVLDPAAAVSRAETAVMFDRMMSLIK